MFKIEMHNRNYRSIWIILYCLAIEQSLTVVVLFNIVVGIKFLQDEKWH